MGILFRHRNSTHSKRSWAWKNPEDNKDASVEQEGQTYSPVTVYDNGDQVRVNVGDKEMFKVVDDGDSTYVKVGKNKMVEVYDHPDSTRIRVGNKEISIVENNNKADIHIGRVKDT